MVTFGQNHELPNSPSCGFQVFRLARTCYLWSRLKICLYCTCGDSRHCGSLSSIKEITILVDCAQVLYLKPITPSSYTKNLMRIVTFLWQKPQWTHFFFFTQYNFPHPVLDLAGRMRLYFLLSLHFESHLWPINGNVRKENWISSRTTVFHCAIKILVRKNALEIDRKSINFWRILPEICQFLA